MSNIKTLFALHLLLMVYSMSGIFSKHASSCEFLSFSFCLYYGCVILLLGIYAIGWQQIIKRIPLTLAFANKSVTVIWGLILGAIFYHEQITIGKVVGAMLIISGIVLYAFSSRNDTSQEAKGV